MKDEEIKLQYQVQISNRFDTLITSNENADEVDINDTWENIRDNIKVATGESIGYYEVKKRKPWFDDDCLNVVERRKQARLKFLQDPKQLNRDNYHTERLETSCTLRNKKRDYLKGKLSEIDTNRKNKNIRDVYKGINHIAMLGNEQCLASNC